MKNYQRNLLFSIALVCALATTTLAQTTTFTYQGRFTDSTVAQPTNGVYSMHFALFDAVSGGNPSGVTVDIPAVQVVNGIFTVSLDYGAASFDGTARFLQVTVGSTILSPRQEITSAPYAITALNALTANRAGDSARLGGIPADQYVTGQVVRSVNGLTNNVTLAAGTNITITPVGNTLTIASTGGGGSGINNQTSLQTSANFNIDGTGAANIFNAATQFNIGGNRFLSGGGGNIFAGLNAGTATTGGDNAFVGTNAGMANITGFNNSFFGTDAGRSNTATNNSFFGRSAGFANTTGANNSFFGLDAGRFNTTGDKNAFFGVEAGSKNTIGINNSFVGGFAGFNNLTGADNSFVGLSSGFSNTLGSNNTFVGRDAGQNNTTGNTNSFFGNFAGFANTTGSNNSAFGNQADFGVNNLTFATAIGAGAVVSTSNTINLGRSNGSDTVRIFGLGGAAGATALCRNVLSEISICTGGGGSIFINNSTVLQPTSNFNISGGGTIGGILSANIVNSATNYRIGGVNVFSTPNQTSVVAGQSSNFTLVGSNSAFFGYKAGQAANGFSQANTFIGSDSGELTTSGGNNTFVGKDSGFFNSSGSLNSFFGSSAGQNNTTANANSFFGYESGFLNSTGTRNAFFGFQSGRQSATVNDNSFFGYQAGNATTGGNNSFFGSLAGSANTTGANNSFFGSSAGLANNGGGNAFFGDSSGLINTSGIRNTFIGAKAGYTNTTGDNNTLVGFEARSVNGHQNAVIGSGSLAEGNQNTIIGGTSYSTGDANTVIGYQTTVEGGNNTAVGSGAKVQKFNAMFPAPTFATAVGAGAVANTSNTVVLGRSVDVVRVEGVLSVNTAFANTATISSLEIQADTKLTAISSWTNTGTIPLCRNGNNLLSNCPPSFSGSQSAFTKEQTAQIETQAAQNKEQQAQIEKQAEQIKQQQMQIEALKQTVCAMNPAAAICVK